MEAILKQHMTRISTIILLFVLAFLQLGCNSENANDCLQTSGTIIQEEFTVTPFSRILVNRDIEMIISVGTEYSVIVETGKNLLNDVEVNVIGDRLILTDNNTCNLVRPYGITKVFVTAPDLTEIRSSTQLDIRSQGTLTFANLHLQSEDANENALNTGNFYLDIDNESLRLTFNNLSNAFITGETERLNIGFFSGNGRFEGENLMADEVDLFHRGSNDIIVHPLSRISGTIYSTGDVIALNRPSTVDVEELYQGRLIFRD